MTSPSSPLEYWSIDGELICIQEYSHIGFQEDVGVCRRYYDPRTGEVWLERLVVGQMRQLWIYTSRPRCRRDDPELAATPYEEREDQIPTAILAWEFLERTNE